MSDFNYKPRSSYSKEEQQIIELYYPSGGANLCKQYLPHRSKDSIQVKAQKLGITTTFTVDNAWSTEEINLLKFYYPQGGKHLCKQYLPNRSLIAILQASKKFQLDYKYKNKKTWFKKDEDFLEAHYSTKGAAWCSKQLNRNVLAVRTQANRLGLTLVEDCIIKQNKHTLESNAIIRDFSNIYDLTNPKIVYLLGLLWADGCVSKSIIISNVSEDLDEIINKLDLINLLPGVSIKYRQPQRNGWKPQTTVTFGNKYIVNWFRQNGYNKSRLTEPFILDNIPENLIPLWIRGLMDGDGCYVISSKKPSIGLAGYCETTYNFLTKILNKLSISYRAFCPLPTKNSKSSRVVVAGIDNCKKFVNFVYQDWELNQLGLERKYNKATSMLALQYKFYKVT